MEPKGVEQINLFLENVIRGIGRNGLGDHLNQYTEVHVTHTYQGERLLVHVTFYNPRAYTHFETSCILALDPEHR